MQVVKLEHRREGPCTHGGISGWAPFPFDVEDRRGGRRRASPPHRQPSPQRGKHGVGFVLRGGWETGKEPTSARAILLDSALSPGGVKSRKTAGGDFFALRSARLSHADSPNATRSPITSACSCRILPAGIEISASRRRASIPTFSAPVTTQRIRRERLSMG